MRHLSPLALPLFLPLFVLAADWPQWRGPNRDGVSKDTGLLKDWPKGGPTLVWTYKDAGVGYSSSAVVGDRLYTMGDRDKDEFLICLDAAKGTEVWTAKVGPAFDFDGNQWGPGPRTTPSVADGRVFALGGGGELLCADAAKGNVVWQVNLPKKLNAVVNPIQGGKGGWGFSWSPLVDGDKLICFPGGPDGAVAALNAKTGEVLWRSKELKAEASYASPIVAEVQGVRQYIVLSNEGAAGVSASDGELLWTYKKKYGDVVIPTPIYSDNHVYVSAGYASLPSCDLIELKKDGTTFTASKVYNNRAIKSMVGGLVLVDGHLYGYSQRLGWFCQNFKSGKVVWSNQNVLGPGSLIAAEGNLYCHDEDTGEVALAEASTKEWKELGRLKPSAKSKNRAVSGRNWTPPVIANGHLFIRDQELLFCYKIK